MEAVVIGAVIGVAFQQFYDSIVAAVIKSSGLKHQLRLLEATVKVLTRKFQEIGELLVQLEQNFPEEILKLQQLLEKAQHLVSKCSTVSTWNLYKKRKYKKRLAELDLSLKKMLEFDFRAAELKYTVEVLVRFVEMNKKLDVMFDKFETNGDDVAAGGIGEERRSFGPRFEMSYSTKKEKVLQVRFL